MIIHLPEKLGLKIVTRGSEGGGGGSLDFDVWQHVKIHIAITQRPFIRG